METSIDHYFRRNGKAKFLIAAQGKGPRTINPRFPFRNIETRVTSADAKPSLSLSNVAEQKELIEKRVTVSPRLFYGRSVVAKG